MRLLGVILIFCFSTFSKAQTYEKVLNDCFLEIIGTSYYEPFPPPPIHIQLDVFSTKQDSLDYLNLKIDYKNKEKEIEINNQRKIILISDYHLHINAFDISKINELEITDVHFKNLREKLTGNSKVSSDKIDIEKISNIGEYELIYLSQKENLQKPFRLIFKIYFSEIVFNENYDNALFCYSLICGSDCGHSSLVYLEKIDGKWKLINQFELYHS
jgi:hypothetical protein